MENKKCDYSLNLDILVPFFLIGKEEIKNRAWFKRNKEKYENTAKECYDEYFLTTSEEEEQITRWENENWICNLFNKNISFILEKRTNTKWPEVGFVLKIYFSEWNTDHSSFEDQIKHLLKTFFREKIITSLEDKVKFKLRFYGKNEEK